MAKAMSAHTSHVEEVDFQPEPEPTAGETEITWRWATAADMPALRIAHFQAEVAAGQAMYLPERPSDQRNCAALSGRSSTRLPTR